MEHALVIAIFTLCIVIHEFGHYLAAKAVGIPIERFSIGFGPALVKWTMFDTEFRISPLLLGGYVKPAVDDDTIRRVISKPKRLLFYISGPLANAVSPIILFMLAALWFKGFSYEVVEIPGKIFQLTVDMFSQAISSSESPELAGPVGIVNEGASFMKTWMGAAIFFYVISINLAIMNLLPLPILDGGRVAMMLMEDFKFWKYVETPAMVLSVVFMLGLTVYVTYADIVKIVS